MDTSTQMVDTMIGRTSDGATVVLPAILYLFLTLFFFLLIGGIIVSAFKKVGRSIFK